jgi:hypothetical protein
VGWLPNRLPVTVVAWLYNEVPSPPGRAAVWLEEARAPALSLGMPAAVLRFGEHDLEAADGGRDDRDRPA